MDFTYYEAFFLGGVLGFFTSAGFVVIRCGGAGLMLISALALTLIADAVLLINWGAAGQMPLVFIVLDLALITVFSAIGNGFGALPILLARRFWHYLQAKRAV
ncbi:hypothetical protein [Nitrospirillum viridazoti]|uniref:Uncharacterized protein n=1 Tax=Nitrospirillum amazonense TaxID=28077 RepID=A0A560IVV0_9PROT|nr:hypothetical protein [Nitrospirillum amazonense]TWB62289.1 hypothetical protein FBZ92_105225 [Nitrospirillum amazonense]